MLLRQRRPQLGQLLGAVLEHAEDRLAVGNVERDDPGFAVVGAFEPFGGLDEFGLAEADGEVDDRSVSDRYPCEPHDTTVHMFVPARKCPLRTCRAMPHYSGAGESGGALR